MTLPRFASRTPARPRRARRFLTVLTAVVALLVPSVPAANALSLGSLTPTLTVNWATWLPGFRGPFDPASSDECLSGKDNCVTKTINEMSKRLDEFLATCDHNAVFALAYSRITQGYRWIRDTYNADGSQHYQDKAYMNYVVETFARAYLRALDDWLSPDHEAVPAWELALDAAAARAATGSGDFTVGINAHINRDLAFVMAASGLVRPDGKSGKPDYDKVNELLNMLTSPLSAELSARLDPSMASGEGSLADPATFNLIVGWRERAWRNAEALASALTDVDRALVAERIEADALAEGAALLATSVYTPPLSDTTARDEYCAVHRYDAAPKPYPFAVK